MKNECVWTRGKPSPDHKQLIVAIDHGMSFPDMPGLGTPFELLRSLADNPYVDGIIASPGVFRNAARHGIDLSGKNRILVTDFVAMDESGGKTRLTHRRMVISPEAGDACDPDCYKFFFNVYPDKDRLMENCRDLAQYAAAAAERGISCLAEIMFYENEAFQDSKRQADELFKGCRMAMELGADVLKIPMIENTEAIGEIATRLKLPVFVLGGGRRGSDAELLEAIRKVCRQPICGLMFGRNIWQSEDIESTIAAIRSVLGLGPAEVNRR